MKFQYNSDSPISDSLNMQSVTPKLIASPLVNATVAFVKDQLSSNDASHDWQHIERVWNLARVLAREEVR